MSAQPVPYSSTIEPNADAEFPAELGRYHLYVTYSCPFACRAWAARNLKGLEDVIGLSIAHPVYQKSKPDDKNDTHLGWVFVDPETTPTVIGFNGKEYPTEGCTPDSVNHAKFVRDLYEKVDPTLRKFSVPVLWDKKKQTIVSEESTGILRTLDSGFRDLVASSFQLYPEELREEIDAIENGLLTEISMSLIKSLFAKDSETARVELERGFESIAKLDELLSKQRYLVGKGVTEADIRLFNTLIRVDVSQKKTNQQNLTQFPNVVGYLRDLYHIPAMKRTVNWDHLKIAIVNHRPDAPVAEGPFIDYDAPHNRAGLL
ncbi:Glutathionyl-hydroquinone reductase YqjG [Phytophthora ramorum]|uniref:Glutathionyl-hydroquinone reductase YqjG n=1 Tax=Phytophthora ramorum TaxID=164328 RepID=UPI0030B45E18|nr:Glutathionyl-hydroquinone reductase YqjG [Phytophthora ramorum]